MSTTISNLKFSGGYPSMEHDNYKEVIIHPVFNQRFITLEHYDGEYQYLGDMLGRDCIIVRFIDGWLRMYANEGKENE